MGFEDRDYARRSGQGVFLGGQRSMVTNLMLVTVGAYIVQLLVDGTNPLIPARLTYFLSLKASVLSSEVFTHPWWLLNLVTYGFVHSRTDLLHIVFNMAGLWFFGRDIEAMYGRKQFLYLYLTAIIFSGLVWAGVETLGQRDGPMAVVLGASGAISAVLTLFVLNFPHRTVLLNFFIPVPAWVLGVLFLLGDMWNAISRPEGSNVAYVAHLGGLAFGLLYFKTGWSLARIVPRNLPLDRIPFKRPKLRIHSPEDFDAEERALSEQVDRILQKIQEQGQDSLTSKERRILERASRRYQQKHR